MSRTAIITGSSSGIGLDVARAFLKQGANVVLNGRDPDKLRNAAVELGSPDHIGAVAGDIGSAEVGRGLVAMAMARFGGVDVLVNNAGTFGGSPIEDVTEEELDGFLAGNLRGTYLTTQAVVRRMKQQGRGGAIVNVGTVLVDHAIAGFPASAALASKGGVQAITVALAAELSPDRIRVNMVAPGVIRTPMHAGGNVDAYAGLALANRVGEASEITEAIVYLADAEFVTGHVLRVDGGFVTGRVA